MTNGVTFNTSHTNNVIKSPPFNCYLRPVISELMKRSLRLVSPGQHWWGLWTCAACLELLFGARTHADGFKAAPHLLHGAAAM